MSASQGVADLEQFASRLYSGDKAATAMFTSKGWSGLGSELGLNALTAVLGQSQETSAIIFACRALTESMQQLLRSPDELVSFLTALLAAASQRAGELAIPAVEAMCTVASTAMKRSFRHTPAVRAMVGQLTVTVGTVGGRAESTHQVMVACTVLGGLVDAMGERRFSHVAEDVSDARQFRDADLLNIFTAAAVCVKKQRAQWGEVSAATTALRAALHLMERTLSFDFACAMCTEDSQEERVPGPFPPSWNAALTDRALVDRLWALFKTTATTAGTAAAVSSSHGTPASALPPSRTLLRILGALTGLRRETFAIPGSTPAACIEGRRRWLDLVLLQTHVVMERGTHCEDEDVLLCFAQLLASVKVSYSIDELLRNDNFGNWAASLQRFTTQNLTACVTADSAVMTQLVSVLLAVWVKLCGAATSYTTSSNGASYLADFGRQVLTHYLQHGVLGRSEWYAAEEERAFAKGSEGPAFSATSYPLEDDAAGVEEELQLAVELAVYSFCDGGSGPKDGERWGLLADFANAQFHRFERLVAGGVDGAEVFSAVEGASWVLWLAAACVKNEYASAGLSPSSGGASDETRPESLGSLLSEAFLLMDRSLHCAALDGVASVAIRSHFEEAAVAFIGAATTRLVLQRSTSRGGLALAQMLANRLSQCRLLQPEGDLAAFLLGVVAHKAWGVLSAGNVRDVTRARALDWLEKVTEAPTAVRVLRETTAHRRWFASLVPEALPASLGLRTQAYNAEQAHARYQYVRCVARVSLSGLSAAEASSGSPELAELLGAVVAVLQQPAGGAVEALMGALIDLRAVLSCAPRRAYQIILRAVQPLLPELLRATAVPSGVGEPLLVHVLRLTEELANNRSQRIFFGPNSAVPYTLFRDIAACVSAAAPLVSHAFQLSLRQRPASESVVGTTSDAEEWAWVCLELLMRTARNALHGCYCNLGVFQLFGDASLDSLVQGVWTLLASRPYAEVAVRPSVVDAAVAFAGELCGEFFVWVWLGGAAPDVRRVSGLLEATAFPADASVLPWQPMALEALDRLVARCNSPSDGQQLTQVFLAADADMFKRLLSTCLEWTMAPQTATQASSSAGGGSDRQLLLNVLCGLAQLMALHDEGEWAAVRDFFTSRCKTAENVAAVHAAFAQARQVFSAPPSGATATSVPRKEAAQLLVTALQTYF